GPANDYARRINRRKLPDNGPARHSRLDPRNSAALCCLSLRNLSAATDIQNCAEGTRRRCARGRCLRATDPTSRLRPSWEADLSCLRTRIRQLSLEQFSLAIDCDEFGRGATTNCRTSSVLLHGSGHRLVGDLRRNAHDLGSVTAGISVVPKTICPKLYA